MNEKLFLFALKSHELLETDNSEEALELCKLGAEKYPDYPAGLFMLCESYFENEFYEYAQITLNNAISKFPRYLPLRKFEERLTNALLIKEIGEEFENEELTYTPKIEIVHDSETDLSESETDENAIITEEIKLSADAATETKQSAENFLKLVSQIDAETAQEKSLRADNPNLIPGLAFTPLRATKKITGEDFTRQPAQFPEFYSPFDSIDNDSVDNINNYASETIAGILENQGAYNEAIEVYQQLGEQQPEMKDYFDSKINNILAKIRD